MCIVCIAININRNVYMYLNTRIFRLLVTHECCYACLGVSTQLQSSGLVAHENSTFRNLALAVSGPFMASMGAFTRL